MPVQVIGSLIAGTNLDCTGMAWQNHLIYAANDAAWWLFYTTSSDLTHVRCYRSPDGANWSVKNASNAMAGIGGTAGNVTNLADNINGRGRSLACAYKAIGSPANDIVHLCCNTANLATTINQPQHARATLVGGGNLWDAWSITGTGMNYDANQYPGGGGCAIDSNNKPADAVNDYITSGFPAVLRGTNADSGTSWAQGFTTTGNFESTTWFCNAVHVVDLASGALLAVWENAPQVDPNSMTNVRWSLWNGTSWSALGNIFASSITAVDPNSFGIVKRTNTDVHCVLRSGANTYVHMTFNGSTWAAGQAIPSQASLAGGGLAMHSDGTSVWLLVIDSTTGNAVRYLKWTAGAWDAAWSTLESSFATRRNLSCSPSRDANGNIGVIWTQGTGPNYDVAFTTLGVAGAPTNPTAAVAVSAATITAGQTSVLTLTSSNGVSATLNGQNPFSSANGSVDVSPNSPRTVTVAPVSTTTYTYAVTGTSGTTPASDNKTVTVNQPGGGTTVTIDYNTRYQRISGFGAQYGPPGNFLPFGQSSPVDSAQRSHVVGLIFGTLKCNIFAGNHLYESQGSPTTQTDLGNRIPTYSQDSNQNDTRANYAGVPLKGNLSLANFQGYGLAENWNYFANYPSDIAPNNTVGRNLVPQFYMYGNAETDPIDLTNTGVAGWLADLRDGTNNSGHYTSPILPTGTGPQQYIYAVARYVLANIAYMEQTFGYVPPWYQFGTEAISGFISLKASSTYAGGNKNQEMLDLIQKTCDTLRTNGYTTKLIICSEDGFSAENTANGGQDGLAAYVLPRLTSQALQQIGALGYHQNPYGSVYQNLGAYANGATVLGTTGVGNPPGTVGNPATAVGARRAYANLAATYGLEVWQTSVSNGTVGGHASDAKPLPTGDIICDGASFDCLMGRALDIRDQIDYARASAYLLQGSYRTTTQTDSCSGANGESLATFTSFQGDEFLVLGDEPSNTCNITMAGRAIGHWSRHLQPGDRALDAAVSDPGKITTISLVQVNAFQSDTRRDLVVVALNVDTGPRAVTFALTGAAMSGPVAVPEQSTSGNVWANPSNITLTDATHFTATLPARSVTTFVVSTAGAAGMVRARRSTLDSAPRCGTREAAEDDNFGGGAIVQPAAPTASLTLSANTINQGDTVILNLASTGATNSPTPPTINQMTTFGTPPVTVPLSGTIADKPVSSTSYTFAVSGPGGMASVTKPLTVVPVTTQTAPSVARVTSFTVKDNLGVASTLPDGTVTIPSTDARLTITYSTQNAVSAVLQGAFLEATNGQLPISVGSNQTVGPLHVITALPGNPPVSTTYKMKLTDAAGNSIYRRGRIVVTEALPALDPTAGPTVTSTGNGNWMNSTTWSTGAIPGRDSIVRINSNHTVTYTGRAGQAGRILFQDNTATLILTSAGNNPTALYVTDIDQSQGNVQCLAPEGTNVTVIMRNRPRHANDTQNYWRAWHVGGTAKLTMRSSLVCTARAKLQDSAHVGDTLLRLATPVSGWLPAHNLLLTETLERNQFSFHDQFEIVTVDSVSTDGLTVYLTDSLKLDHLCAKNADGSQDTACTADVANLIRSVVVLSTDPADLTTRCHFRATQNATVDLEGYVFHGLGRTSGNYITTNVDTNIAERHCLYLDDLIGPVGPAGLSTLPLNTADGSTNVNRSTYQHWMNNGVVLEPWPVVTQRTDTLTRARWGVTISGKTHYGYFGNTTVFNWCGSNFVLVGVDKFDGLFPCYNTIDSNLFAFGNGQGARANDRNGVALCPQRLSNWVYAVGDVVVVPGSGHFFYCKTAGTSAATAPAFNTATNSLTTDGGAVFQEAGPATNDLHELAWEGNGVWWNSLLNYFKGNTACNINSYWGLQGINSTAVRGFQGAPGAFGWYLVIGVADTGFIGNGNYNVRKPLYQGADTQSGTAGVEYTQFTSDTMVLPPGPNWGFTDNEVYGCLNGITLNNLTSTQVGGGMAPTPSPANVNTFRNFKSWHCFWQFYGYPSSYVTLDGWHARGDTTRALQVSDTSELFAGTSGSDYMNAFYVIQNSSLEGGSYGVKFHSDFGRSDSSGSTLMWFIIKNSTVKCYYNFAMLTPWAVDAGPDHHTNRAVAIENCTTGQITAGTDRNSGGDPQLDFMHYHFDQPHVSQAINWILRSSVYFYNHQNINGNNFQVWLPQQLGSDITPATDTSGGDTARGAQTVGGTPVVGQTNTFNLANNGVCLYAAIIPGGATNSNLRYQSYFGASQYSNVGSSANRRVCYISTGTNPTMP